MTTWFERDVQRAATRARAGPFESKNFSVWKTGTKMIASSDDSSPVDDDGTD
jgi:hypothetical protein